MSCTELHRFQSVLLFFFSSQNRALNHLFTNMSICEKNFISELALKCEYSKPQIAGETLLT